MSAPENAGSLGRYVTGADMDPAVDSAPNLERYRIFRLCECSECDGGGKVLPPIQDIGPPMERSSTDRVRCPECRGEGRVRQEIATCPTPEALGVALVTLGREGEFEECPIGILDSEGEVGQKWLVRPWTPSARNVTDAARTLAKSRGGRS